jgi:hypothetical protein
MLFSSVRFALGLLRQESEVVWEVGIRVAYLRYYAGIEVL